MERRVVESVSVLTPTEKVLAGQEAADLLSAAEEILKHEAPRIVVDLTRVDGLLPGGLGALIRVQVGCINRGGWLRIIGVNRRIRSLVRLCPCTYVLNIYDTLDEAIAVPHPTP